MFSGPETWSLAMEQTARAAAPSELEGAFRKDRGLLLGLCYRLTGSPEEAEDIVQETFARAIERPPPDADRPWRPWLARVAVNLSLDALRRRRRRGYPGTWLPAPLETGEEEAASAAGPASGDAGARYELLESASFAFLLALEALTPRQRAALILQDVFDYSAREVAELLGTSEGSARVSLHRARRAMAGYDRARSRPTRELRERTRQALAELLRCLVERDLSGLERLLAEDVRALTDGGGVYTAVPRPLAGRARVMRLLLQVAGRRAAGARIEPRLANGLPALGIEFASAVRRQAPRLLLRCELDAAGRIRELHALLAPGKLAILRPPPAVP
jgi:RNA polymerase sigma-70 factor (ECF subfamily)